MECIECDFKFVKQSKVNGDFMLKKQCFKCGQCEGKTFKFDLIGGKQNLFNIPILNEEKLRLFYDLQQQKRQTEYAVKLEEKRKEYYEYLKSDKWKLKRQKVMLRDKNICQACLTRQATDVHHLTYKHIYNEPLFDLVAICRPCHEKLHELENDL